MVEKSRKTIFADSNEIFYVNRDRAARRQHKLIAMLGKQLKEELSPKDDLLGPPVSRTGK